MKKTIQVAIATGKPGKMINKHLGTAKYFWVYTIEEDKITDKTWIELSDHQTLKSVLHTYPIDFSGHPLEKVEIILSGGMGPGAVQKLFSIGKRGYMIAEKYVDEAVEKLLAGTLQALDPAVHHHHHHHDHDHPNHHGHGHNHSHSSNDISD